MTESIRISAEEAGQKLIDSIAEHRCDCLLAVAVGQVNVITTISGHRFPTVNRATMNFNCDMVELKMLYIRDRKLMVPVVIGDDEDPVELNPGSMIGIKVDTQHILRFYFTGEELVQLLGEFSLSELDNVVIFNKLGYT